jgi:hypothetical protein
MDSKVTSENSCSSIMLVTFLNSQYLTDFGVIERVSWKSAGSSVVMSLVENCQGDPCAEANDSLRAMSNAVNTT